MDGCADDLTHTHTGANQYLPRALTDLHLYDSPQRTRRAGEKENESQERGRDK